MWKPRPKSDMKILLMQINLFHQYYDDGIMHYMRLQPDHETQVFFDRYRLIARQSQGIYALYYFGSGMPQNIGQMLNHSLGEQPLVFNLISNNDSFAIITDLPVNWCGQLQYTSNKVISKLEPVQSQQQSSEPLQTIELAMQLQPRTMTMASFVGQIVIFPKDLLTTEGQVRQPSFAIKMKARLTHWIYYIINRSQIKLAKLEINNTQGIIFEPPKQVTLKNGEQALMFRSGEHCFALSETVKSPFNLVSLMPTDPEHGLYPRLNVKQLITVLPIPKTDLVSVELCDRHLYVYSPMYVYI